MPNRMHTLMTLHLLDVTGVETLNLPELKEIIAGPHTWHIAKGGAQAVFKPFRASTKLKKTR